MYSSLTRISESKPLQILLSRTIGVFPMSSSMLSWIFLLMFDCLFRRENPRDYSSSWPMFMALALSM